MNISVIIPCYNEEKTIIEVVNSVKKYLQENDEIIVIDDCSTDNSFEIIKLLAKSNKDIKSIFSKKNLGKGGALKKGIKDK